MDQLDLGHPEMLALLWLVPVAVILLWLAERRRRRRLGLVAGGSSAVTIRSGRTVLKGALVAAALALLALALAQPRWGFEWTDVHRHGSDIVIAIDVSNSMLAQDINPSRLARAKREVADLLDLLQGDRVGLVAFAGEAFVECPLTEDYAAARLFLNYLDPDLIPVQGTDLGAAVDTSLKALFDGSPDQSEGRAIILITDGEDQEGNAVKAAEAAKAKGVRLYTIGIGSQSGAPIPEPEGGFKKDAAGNVVVTKPDEAALQQMALASGGLFVRSVAGGMDLAEIYQNGIRKAVAQTDYKSTRQKLWFDRFQWFLGAALLCLIGEHFLRDVRLAVLLLALLSGFGAPKAWATSLREAHGAYESGDYATAAKGFGEAEAADPEDPGHAYNRAVSQYRQKDYAGAAAGFQRAAEAKDQRLAEQAFYNLGNTQALAGKLDEAAKAYESALALDPNDREAKDNLEYVRQQKQKQDQQKQDQQKQDQQKQDQKPDQQKQDQQQNQAQSQPQNDQQKQDQQKQDQQKQDQQQNQAQSQTQNDQQKQDQQKQDQQQNQAQSPSPSDQQKQKPDQQKQDQQPSSADKDQQKQDQTAQSQPEGEKQTPSETTAKAQGEPETQAMNRDEAEAVLRSVDDNVKKFLFAPKTRAAPPPRSAKDW